MVCSKCGAQPASSTDTFCSVCGTPVARTAQQAAPGYMPQNQSGYAGQAGAPSGYAPGMQGASAYINANASAAPVKKKSILPVLLAILLIAVAVAAVWYFFLREKEAQNTGTPYETVSQSDDSDEESISAREKRETDAPPVREPGQGIRLPGIFGGGASGDAMPAETAPTVDESATPEPEPTPEPVPETPDTVYPPPVFSAVLSSDVTDSPTGRNYLPDQAVDGKPETAWNVPGTSGEWIALEADSEQYVTGLRILNGYTKYSPEYSTWLYYRNNRPKDIRILFSDGSVVEWTLGDIFDEDNYLYQDIPLDTPKLTAFIMIYIDSVYEGDRWDDICISEIEVY